jgi:beta-lactamase regulating signal transducer with metallopeptidase domain
MADLLKLGLINAAMASCLAILATVVGKFFRKPALTHSLWLLVFIKLVTPPLVPIEIRWPEKPIAKANRASVEEEESSEAVEEGHQIASVPLREFAVRAQPEDPIVQESMPMAVNANWAEIALAGWIAGSISWWVLACVRIHGFQRLLRFASPAPEDALARVRLLSACIGLSKPPRVSFLPGNVSPMIWWLGKAPRLLLPIALWERLGEAERDTLLLHELAHLRRGDHRVRILELAVLGLYWWLPVAWWARRQLREAEELCCDAWVIWALPDSARAYAETLVETLTYLANARRALPILASGIGAVPLMRRRLTMILNDSPPRKLSRIGALLMVGVAALILPLWPAWGQTKPAVQLTARPAVAPPEALSPQEPSAPIAEPRVDPFQAEAQQATRPLAAAVASNDNEGEELQEAREQLDLLRSKLTIKKAQVEMAQANLELTKERFAQAEKMRKNGNISSSDFADLKHSFENARLELQVKLAELREPEILVKKAQRRLAFLRAGGGADGIPQQHPSLVPPMPTPDGVPAAVPAPGFSFVPPASTLPASPAALGLPGAVVAPIRVTPGQMIPPPMAEVADAGSHRINDLEKKLDLLLSQVQDMRKELKTMREPVRKLERP